jgi:isopenicillin N synthase-like dioxygenase
VTEAIPLIDLTDWYDGDDNDRARIAGLVDTALQEAGFLLVTGHKVPAALADDVRTQTRSFFALPIDTKKQYATGPGGHGWIPSGAEANAGSDGIETPPDLKESYGFGPSEFTEEESESGWYWANVWPEDQPQMKAACVEYADHCADLADDLLEIFALALDLPTNFFTSRCDRSPWQTNINWYPAMDAVGAVADQQYRIGQHTDFGSLTILDRQPGSGGLQVRSLDGQWIDAPWVPGSLTINTGDLLARWTADRWRSTPHRVLPPPADEPTEELLSLVFFHEANPSTVVESLPTGKAGPATYEPVTAGDFLRARINSITVAAAE